MVTKTNIAQTVAAISDNYLPIYLALESDGARLQARPKSRARRGGEEQLYESLVEVSHRQASELAELTESYPLEKLAAAFRATPLHQRVLLQSAFIRRALEKPRGYAGDTELMVMICTRGEVGSTLFGRLLNRVYLDLPASEAVRQRVRLLAALLRTLPDDTNVLNVACGPALEVPLGLDAGGPAVHVDLLDHDPKALEHAQVGLSGIPHRLLKANIFRVMANDRRVKVLEAGPDAGTSGPGWSFTEHDADLTAGYDLIYSSGLFDYVPDGYAPKTGAQALTRVLFDLLKPGGRLLIGNFLQPSPTNPHREHHRVMMQVYSDWQLIYRSPSEITGLADAIPAGAFTCRVVDEYGDILTNGARGAIGFLDIRRAV